MTDLMDFGWNTDRFFRDLVERVEFSEEGYCISPPMKTFRHNGSFVVRVDLPGVNAQDVHLTAEHGRLTIEGERKRSTEVGEDALFRDELWYGSFRRSVEIPDGLKTDQIKAKYHDGVLEITAPIGEEHLPKKIEVEIQKN
jgi:HSP20 family protein